MKTVQRSLPLSDRVHSNLLQQDCYVRDCCLAQDVAPAVYPSKYTTLQETVTQTGLKQEFVSVDYPITAESVNSYVESCDYRRDPFGAIARGSNGVNLGDVTDLQAVSSMDSEQARALYKQLQARFSSVVAATSDTAQAVSSGSENLEKEGE